MQINLRTGKPDAEGIERINRMEVTGAPYDHIPRSRTYGMNNNLVVFTDEEGKTFLAAREAAEGVLEQEGFLNTGANVLFSQSPHLVLDELRGNRRHIREDVRITDFQKAYGTKDKTLWYLF